MRAVAIRFPDDKDVSDNRGISNRLKYGKSQQKVDRIVLLSTYFSICARVMTPLSRMNGTPHGVTNLTKDDSLVFFVVLVDIGEAAPVSLVEKVLIIGGIRKGSSTKVLDLRDKGVVGAVFNTGSKAFVGDGHGDY